MSIVLERHQKAVDAFNDHDPDRVVELYATDAVLHDPQHPKPVHGRAEIREVYAEAMRSFSDMRVAIVSRHLDGDRMMYEIRVTGTNDGPVPAPEGEIPATGRRIDLPMAVFADLSPDGHFQHVRRYYDVAEMTRQLGLTG